jgi:hypothetical protein
MLTFQRDCGLFIHFDEVKWGWQVVDPHTQGMESENQLSPDLSR